MCNRNISRIDASLLFRYIRTTRGTSTKEFCQILDISKSQYSRLSSGISLLTFENTCKIEERFDLLLSKVYKGMVFENPNMHLFSLPRCYQENQFTKKLSIFYIWLLRKYLGIKEFNEFMDYEGLPVEYFVNINNPINIRFTLRALQVLIKKGILNCSTIHLFATQFCKIFQLERGSLDSFHDTLCSIYKFEENHEYTVEHVSNKSYTFSFRPKEHIENAIYFNPILGNIVTQWIATLASVISGRSTNIIEDVFNGDSKCVISMT